MIFRELDESGDWVFGKGKQCFFTTEKAINANIKTRILSWVGDCFWDINAGIDWVNRLGSKNQRELLELDLRRIILQSEGVTGLIDFDSTLSGRNFTATYTIETIYSQEFRDRIELEI
jgi:hypothetical protein